MRTAGLTCLSSTLFALPIIITVIIYCGIESHKVLDVLHGKIPLSALLPTVPRPKGPRVIETDMYCNKSYAILPFPGRYMCKSSSPSFHPATPKLDRETLEPIPLVPSVGWPLAGCDARRFCAPPSGATSPTSNFALGAAATRQSQFGTSGCSRRVNNPKADRLLFWRAACLRHVAVDGRHMQSHFAPTNRPEGTARNRTSSQQNWHPPGACGWLAWWQVLTSEGRP
jgi:hypothetical protein